MTKKIYLLGGGTVFHLRPHFALCAPAYGKTVKALDGKFKKALGHYYDNSLLPENSEYMVEVGLTKMAGGTDQTIGWFPFNIGETNEQVGKFLDSIILDTSTKMIFMSVALCDFEGSVGSFPNGTSEPKTYGNGFVRSRSGKNEPRLKSDTQGLYVELTQAEKMISKIRKQRKDIFLVGCKTTAGATEEEQYWAGLNLLKKNSCNLVLANDVQTGLNMIICPELSVYSVTHDRNKVLDDLVEISLARCENTFARTNVAEGVLLPWQAPEVPENLRKVIDWCVEQGAYEAFNNVTVGHFGFKPEANVLYSSRRKQNFNVPACRDLVRVEFGETSQKAFGAKPSAGARSQYMVLSEFPQYDCIVHFHCPMKPGVSAVPVRPQKMFECGSHQCGKNTVAGMKDYGNLAAVMLDKHGPNIVFSKDTPAKDVIKFINTNFDLTKRTR